MGEREEVHRCAVDERLVAPESGFEAIDGQVLHVSPADREHASRHSKLAALLEACCAAGYDAAVDMLKRTSERNDFAPDASVYPVAEEPETGGRQLEVLAFQIVSTETIGHAQKKARAFRGRGVKRVFAIDVERKRVLEYSEVTGVFEILSNTTKLEDATLAAPLEVEALLDATKVDDAIARALLTKKNEVIKAAMASATATATAATEADARGEARGRAQGQAEGRVQGRADGRHRAKCERVALGDRCFDQLSQDGELLSCAVDERVHHR